MKLALKGVIPPMITPLKENGELDEIGLEKLVEHLISGGVHGIFLLGTNGEGPSLSYSLRKHLITKACEYINGRVLVLVGITDTSFEGSIEIAEHSKKAGADVVVVAPPYYFPVSQNEMVVYLENLIPLLPLPMVIYNMPSCTKLHLSVETVRAAKELGAIGIKDSSGDLGYFYSLIDEFKDEPEFKIIIGTEMFLPESIMNGGHGVVAGGANFFPKLFVDLYNASIENNKEKVSELREIVLKVYNTIYEVGKYSSKYTKGTKAVLSEMGICNDYMALPLRKFNNGQIKKIKEYVKEFSIIDVT